MNKIKGEYMLCGVAFAIKEDNIQIHTTADGVIHLPFVDAKNYHEKKVIVTINGGKITSIHECKTNQREKMLASAGSLRGAWTDKEFEEDT